MTDMKANDQSSDERNKKRTRRPAIEIERKFICWCGKAYGTEGSLNQHKKIKKHYSGNMPDSPANERGDPENSEGGNEQY